jgi:hypothetical protein
MILFRLTVATKDGYGFDHSQGDTYEVEAPDYLAAEADVLGREGIPGTQPYARIVKGWVSDGWGGWAEIPACECGNFPARVEWAGSGRMICWDCCEARQEAGR